MSNFMSNSDALQVLGTYANSIKAATPTEITYSQFQQLTPQQQESGNYIVSDWPGSDLQVVDEVADSNMKAVTSNSVYDALHSPRIVVSSFDDIPEIDNGNIFYTRIGDLIIVGGAVHLTARPSPSSIIIAKNLPEPLDYYSTLVPMCCINSTEDVFMPVCLSPSPTTGTYDLYLFNQIVPIKAGWHRISGQYIAK